MKRKLFLIIIIVVNCNAKNVSKISSATAKVISHVCGEDKKLSSVIFNSKHLNNFSFLDEINEILLESTRDQKISLKIVTSNEYENLDNHAHCSVVIINSFDEFKIFYDDKFMTNLDNEHSPLLLILINATTSSIGKDYSEIMNIFKHLWNASIYNVNVMIENDFSGNVLVFTYFPFQSHHCSDMNPVLINKYIAEIDDFINSTVNFFPSKIRDLQKCPINVATSNNSQPYIFVTRQSDGNISLNGRDITVLKTIAKSLNFEINYVFIGGEGILLENGTATGIYKSLIDAKADLAVADMWLKANRLKFIDATSSYAHQQIAFVIPPGAELSSIEKYLRPMDKYTWICSILTILTAFIVIYIIKKKSIYVQNFIFGEHVRDPYLNVLVGLFGGSQKVLPHSNFARFLLMIFLIFCLIMRSLYQGSLYRFLQTKIYHKEVQSIDEMIERDYKFYIVPSILDLVEGHKRIFER